MRMESNNATKMTMTSSDVVEDSETTVEIKIKTLDSQTYTLRVNKYVPVPALKEQIATVTGVLSEQQRLICRGKVLKDDQLLSAYHVEDGHTLHLVVRQPHHSSSPSTSYMGPDVATDQPAANSASDSAHNRSNHVARSFVFETVNMDQGDIDTPPLISQIISNIMDSFGPTARTRSTRVDLRDAGSERHGRASSDGSQRPPIPTAGPTGFRFAPTVALSSQNPTVLPDSLTTLHHYLGFMRDEFRRERFGVNDRDNHNNSEAAGMSHNEGHGSLPSPASLAEILLSTRQLFMEQAAECFEQLARQLEGHTSVTDAAARITIQNAAARYAVVMQNLGSLLLELGRATGTLRMGRTAAEAFVNAGPATFISASGPNPLMVQMAPFYPGANPGGVHMGTVNSGHNPETEALDSPFLPRNIEVRIRTVGRAVPVDSANGGEQTGAQTQEPIDPPRNSSGPNVVHQTFSAVPGGESGVRVVPFRTVVAIPGVNHSTSDSSGSGVGLMYPVFTRFRQRSNTSDARASQAFNGHHSGVPEVDRQPNSEPAVQRQNMESNSEGTMRANQVTVNTVPLAPGMGLSASESSENQGSARVFFSSHQRLPNNNGESGTAANDGRQTGRLPLAQVLSHILSSFIPEGLVNVDAINPLDSVTAPEQPYTTRDAEPHGTGVGNDQGVYFSNLLRQVMPLIPQGTALQPEEPANSRSSIAQIERGNDSSSSQHVRDPPESPNAKRLKREES